MTRPIPHPALLVNYSIMLSHPILSTHTKYSIDTPYSDNSSYISPYPINTFYTTLGLASGGHRKHRAKSTKSCVPRRDGQPHGAGRPEVTGESAGEREGVSTHGAGTVQSIPNLIPHSIVHPSLWSWCAVVPISNPNSNPKRIVNPPTMELVHSLPYLLL